MEQQKETFFDHPPTAEDLAGIMCPCHESDDPTSPYYKRELVRPCLHMGKVLLSSTIVLLIATLIAWGAYFLWHSTLWTVLCGVGVICIATISFAKQIAIWLVKVYQRFAPAKLRNKCLFEPSCSQYMIMALEKYGFVRGIYKGIRRLIRCRPPHGGYDAP
jgi:putative membrane protein insertion efficiency factor